MWKVISWSLAVLLAGPLVIGLLFGPLMGVEGSSWGVTLVSWLVAVGVGVWWWRGRRAKRVVLQRGEIAHLPGPGLFAIDVKGESHYQENLAAICGPRTEEGEDRIVTAVLALEDNNPADPNAVRVEIDGKQVGYLARNVAVEYRQQLTKAGFPGLAAAQCSANIRGGWKRPNGDVGHYGVWLDLPTV